VTNTTGLSVSHRYEHGGTVLNVAIRVDNLRPIGAMVRRLPELEVVLVLLGQEGRESRIVCRQLEEMLTYNQPLTPGALLKAAVIVAEVIDIKSPLSLAEQLQQRYGCGFELKTWSNLPQGSGECGFASPFRSPETINKCFIFLPFFYISFCRPWYKQHSCWGAAGGFGSCLWAEVRH